MSDALSRREMIADRLRAIGEEPTARAVAAIAETDDIDAVLERVKGGMPLFRAIGMREFHGLELALSAGTLEPRDDTETLVDAALSTIIDRKADLRIADLGTGTGAVALALLSELPNAHAVATDISTDAVDTAQTNAEAAGLANRFTAQQGSWMEPLIGAFDFIVSNPPYIASDVVDELDPSVRDHDPRAALDGGIDGLDAYRAILARAADHLLPGGALALEIGYDQRESVSALATTNGFGIVSHHQDLGGRDRAIVLRPVR
ncbi:MAG: peptide chain release factor N(5)-glutamine methyltransferase [Pseudomonadota bacterium]